MKGVVASQDGPPEPLRSAIRAKALEMIGKLPEGARGAFVGIVTDQGEGPTANIAVIAHVNGAIDVVGYVGKKWGKPRPEYGGEILWTF
jgi:hypothetical protein